MGTKETIIAKYSESLTDHLLDMAKVYTKGYLNPTISDRLIVIDEISKYLDHMISELNG
jgi:hypothetical protein